MMQKKDLAKEFSLIVQQEIKNHNDSILASNMALEDFKRQLEELKLRSEKYNASLNSDLNLYRSEFREFVGLVKDILADYLRQLNDSKALQVKQVAGIKKALDDRESYFLTLEGFQEFQSKVDQWMSNIKRSFALQKDCLSDEIKDVSKQLENSLLVLEKKIAEKIAEEDKKIEDINKTLDLFAINFSGFTREIEICKKRCFIIEKNIENLYTQIARLKGSAV